MILNIIKILLCIYILISYLNIFNLPKFSLSSDFNKFVSLFLIIILGFINPIIAILTIIVIIINYKKTENFVFTNYTQKDIKNIINTHHEEPKFIPVINNTKTKNNDLDDNFLSE